MNQSIGFSPAAATRTRSCPGPACGAGTARTVRTSGPPNASSWTARLVLAGVLTTGCCMLTCLPGRPMKAPRSGLCSVYNRHRTIIGARSVSARPGIAEDLLDQVAVAGGDAAVDGQRLAGDPARRRRSQKEAGGGDVGRGADPAQRVAGFDPFQQAGGGGQALRPDWGGRRARRDRVEADAAGPVAG